MLWKRVAFAAAPRTMRERPFVPGLFVYPEGRRRIELTASAQSGSIRALGWGAAGW